MGKLIKVTLSLALVIAVIVIMNLGSGIKVTIETLGPKITQLGVSLGAAQIGEGSFKELRIGNPKGFSAEPAMSLGEISFALDTAFPSSDVIVVESLPIVAPEITLESGRGGSNLDKLQENI